MRGFYFTIWLAGCLLLTLSSCSRDLNIESAPVVSVAAVTAVSSSPADHVDWAEMQDFWTRSMALAGIDTGPAASTKHMLVYFDPYCPVCAHQWKILKPYMQTVRIRWIPVAFINADSPRCAAAILASPDPAAALVKNEDGYDFTKRVGSCPSTSLSSIPAWAIEKITANTHSAVVKQYVAGTPAVGFELYNGKRYYRMGGLVEAPSMAIAVAELGDTMDPWKHPSTDEASSSSQ